MGMGGMDVGFWMLYCGPGGFEAYFLRFGNSMAYRLARNTKKGCSRRDLNPQPSVEDRCSCIPRALGQQLHAFRN